MEQKHKKLFFILGGALLVGGVVVAYLNYKQHPFLVSIDYLTNTFTFTQGFTTKTFTIPQGQSYVWGDYTYKFDDNNQLVINKNGVQQGY